MVAKAQPREETFPRYKDSPQLYGCDQEEEVMAAMCHNGETYDVIQPNRVDEACSQQLNQ